MRVFGGEIRYALRQLARSPGFTLTAILTLALGIGANTAIFSLVHAVLLKSLPVGDPSRLVRIGDRDDCCVNGGVPPGNDYPLFAYELYQHLQAGAPEFEQMAAMQSGGETFTVRGSQPGAVAKSTRAEFVSGNYYQTLGLRPYVGRLFVSDDDRPGAQPVAVLSYGAWQREFGGKPSAVGSVISVDTHPVTVIGVTPPEFYGDRMMENPPELFLPMVVEPSLHVSPFLHQRDENWVYILGRLRPGVTLAPLQAKLSGRLREYLSTLDVYKRADEQKNLAESHVVLTPGGAGIQNMQQQYGQGFKLLAAISAFVLLIACANLANLLLVRGMARAGEISLRMALGASRARIVRQLVIESMLLAIFGGMAGVAVAYGSTRMLLSLAFPDATASLPISASPSVPVLLFAFALSLGTGLLFGLLPAWMNSRSEPVESLRGANRTTRDGSPLLQKVLVVGQAALSLVLLVAAGLMSQSLGNLQHQDLGLQTSHRFVSHLDPEAAGYKIDQLDALYREILDGVHALPGVRRAALSLYSPQEGNSWGEGVYIGGRPEPHAGEDINARFLRASPEFFSVIGQKVVRGRGITDADTPTSQEVVVVNQAFVRHFFSHGEDPIGQQLGIDMKSSHDFTIVGVVNDAKYFDLREPVPPMFFLAPLQSKGVDQKGELRSLYLDALMVETDGPTPGLERELSSVLTRINPNLPLVGFTTFEHQVASQLNQDRMLARLTELFGGLALLLASVGIYGVTSYTVARRTGEIGVRMALGADRASVVRMVMRGALAQAALGLCIGIPVALLGAHLLEAQLYGLHGYDPRVLVLAACTLGLAAAVAGLLPARRAASVDPLAAMRTE